MKFWLIIFSMSSLIIEDLNSFSFLSIIVLKSSLLTSFLSSWTAAAEKKQNKQKKTMCPSNCHHNGFVATHALGHMMYGYKLLVPMNQRVLNKRSKELNISSHKWSTTHRVLKSQKSKMGLICTYGVDTLIHLYILFYTQYESVWNMYQ